MKTHFHTLVHHFLEGSAEKFPDKVALVHENVRATYAQINAKANQLANLLIDQGVTRGDRVALILENGLEYVISYYGSLKAGAVVAPLSSDIKPDGLRYLLGKLEAKAIISAAKYENILQESDLSKFHLQALVLKSPKLKWSSNSPAILSWDDLFNGDNSPSPNLRIEETALASSIFTSGST